jgi:SAM-dependent methyltransferase
MGQKALGIDLSPTAIELARAKAVERGASARFLVADALALEALGEVFDTVLDCGFFHVLDDLARGRFVEGLRHVVRSPGGRYHLLCFSERQLGVMGPRRVTQGEIRAAFADGWHVERIEPARLETLTHDGGAEAWLATISRV